MKNQFLITAINAIMIAGHVTGGTIDFEGLPAGPVPGGAVTFIMDGVPVTFSANGLAVDVGNPVHLGANHILHSGSYYDPITVTFGMGFTANFVEIRNVFDSLSPVETDIIRGDAYSASGLLLGSLVSSGSIHRLDGPSIARVIYDDVGDTAFSIDDFTFQAVPEPTAFALLVVGTGAALAQFIARRRKGISG